MVLLPKRPGWDIFRDLRPIALFAITQKVFAKVLLQFTPPMHSAKRGVYIWLFGPGTSHPS